MIKNFLYSTLKSPFVVILFIYQAFLLITLNLSSSLINLSWSLVDVGGVLLSFVSLFVITLFFKTLFNRKERWFTIWKYVFLFFCGIFASYLITTSSSADFAIIADNFTSSLSQEATMVILNSFKLDPFLVTLVLMGILRVLEKRQKQLTAPSTHRVISPWVVGVFYLMIVVAPVQSFDEPTTFVKSIYFYINKKYMSDETTGFIDKKPIQSGFVAPAGFEKPNIIFLVVESFNTRFVGTKDRLGRPYTPYFNDLRKTGLYVEKFYGNSVQTGRGHFAIMSGILPSYHGQTMEMFESSSVRTLADILGEMGYATQFFQSYHNPNFDNTKNFVLSHGFDNFYLLEDFVTPEDSDKRWKWGYTDEVLYKHFFDNLDKTVSDQSDKPFFAMVPTIFSHPSFTVSEHLRYRFKDAQNPLEHYANAIYVADLGLKYFFKEFKKRDYLKNTIVVITGDHSIPVTTEGTFNQAGIKDHTFKTPFLMIWPEGIVPSVQHEPASQVDIAPTILDIVGYEGAEYMQGQSLFLPRPLNYPISILQPYNGTYFGHIEYPNKFLYRLKTREFLLFDLEADPDEKNNVISKLTKADKQALLKKTDIFKKTYYTLSQDKFD